ncbi:MAG: hypothetical protein M0Q38_01800 [Bacteroidales bacterium]|jgi:hypothetical protein|nr:hypothetical protein [Bacteroidales bacterium]
MEQFHAFRKDKFEFKGTTYIIIFMFMILHLLTRRINPAKSETKVFWVQAVGFILTKKNPEPMIMPDILAIRSLILNVRYGRKYWVASQKMAKKRPEIMRKLFL